MVHAIFVLLPKLWFFGVLPKLWWSSEVTLSFVMTFAEDLVVCRDVTFCSKRNLSFELCFMEEFPLRCVVASWPLPVDESREDYVKRCCVVAGEMWDLHALQRKKLHQDLLGKRALQPSKTDNKQLPKLIVQKDYRGKISNELL